MNDFEHGWERGWKAAIDEAEQRVKELERELEIVTKERTHWFRKSQGIKCDDEALLCEIYNGEK